MSSLFTTIEGSGQPLVVLHGWGMNQQVWQPIRQSLAELAEVTYIDLAGHGQSEKRDLGDLEQVVEDLISLIPDNAIVMGWSLGGMVAQVLAKRLEHRVKALVLVATTPQFTNSNWQYGLDESIVTGFAQNLQKDYEATVKRFFALQFMGVKTDAKELAAFRDSIMQYPADLKALQDGMHILQSFNQTEQRVKQPCLWVLGRLDKLIPITLKDALTAMSYRDDEIVVMRRAAHVPFVTHRDDFMNIVTPFIQRHA